VDKIRKIAVVDMQTGDRYFFDSYFDAQEFIKGKKGRWYLTRPDMRNSSIK